MKHQQLNSSHQIAVTAGLMLLSLAGCKYDRSFMNIDSNSGSPFFGLQLAVDSGSRPPGPDQREDESAFPGPPRHPVGAAPRHTGSESNALSPVLLTRTATNRHQNFESTSESRELNSNLRYTLQTPVTDETLRAQAIDLRRSAF